MKKLKEKIENLLHVFKRHVFFSILVGDFAKPLHFIKTILKHKLLGYPYLAMVETCNFCNLQCPTCSTPHGKISREKQMLQLTDYKKIIDNIKDSISVVLPWFANEPLLNPDLVEMIKYADKNHIYTMISTNAVLLNDKKARELLDSGLDEILLCLDGTTKESYEPFRKGAEFEEVLKNIKNFCTLKKESKRKRPFVELQFILNKLNQGEVEEIKKLSRSLGVDRLRIKSLALSEYAYSKEEIKELSQKFFPNDSKYASKIRYKTEDGGLAIKNRKPICKMVSSSIVVLVDGRISICCYDIDGQYIYGNILEQKLEPLWKSKPVCKKREMASQRKYPLCKTCAN